MMNGAYGAYNSGINGLCGSGMFGLSFSALLFAGLAFLALYLLFKNKRQPPKKEPIFINEKSSTVDAAEIIRLRYARGEISFEEFQTLLKNIQA